MQRGSEYSYNFKAFLDFHVLLDNRRETEYCYLWMLDTAINASYITAKDKNQLMEKVTLPAKQLQNYIFPSIALAIFWFVGCPNFFSSVLSLFSSILFFPSTLSSLSFFL